MTQNEKILNSIFYEYAMAKNRSHTMIRRILNCENITSPRKEEFIEEILEISFEENPHKKQISEFIKQSPFLLKNDGFTCVGQYKEWFWISSEEDGYIFYCGTTIQELAYSTNSNLHDMADTEEFKEFTNDFIKNKELTENIINNFVKICNDNGVSFDFAKIKNVKVDKNEERKFIEAVQQEFGFTPEPSYIGQVG